MKNRLLHLLLFVLLMPMAMWGQETLKLYENTYSSTNQIPIQGSATNKNDLKCEYIIPASDLAAMAGTNIYAMDYYLSTPAYGSWGTAQFQVFLKEVEETEFLSSSPSFYGTTDATIVYTGSLNATGNVMTIPFSTGYAYSGGNLLVGIYITQTGATSNAYFYAKATNEWWVGPTTYPAYQGSNGSYARRTYIPRSNFVYALESMTYIRPRNLMLTDLTSTSATITWTNGGNETAWQIVYSTDPNFDPDAVTPTAVTTKPYTMDGLTTDTTYYACLRSDYGSGNYSAWSDRIDITPECFPVFNFAATSTTPNSATLNWTSYGTETSWQLVYSTNSEFDPNEATPIDITERPYTLNGLTAETTYYAYVRANCGDSHYSVWSNLSCFTPSNAIDALVVDGSNTNSYVPVYLSMVDYQTIRSQFIIPSDNLASLAYGHIKKLSFYLNPDMEYYASWDGADFEIYLMETDDASFSNSTLVSWSDMTKVYDGRVVINNNKMEIALPVAYDYSDSNLMIGIYQKEIGASGYGSWLGTTTTSNTAIYGYGSSNPLVQFLPKTTISYFEGTIPTCLKPKNLTSYNIGATSATLSWTAGGAETAWVLQYATDAEFTENVVSTNITTNPCSLSGLTSETTYFARVKASCGGDDYSAWSNVCSFTPSVMIMHTVNDGTVTNYMVPIYGSGLTIMSQSQFVLPASVLANMNGKDIGKMTFYCAVDNVSWGAAEFDVCLKEVDYTSIPSKTHDWTGMTTVYSGSLSVSDGLMAIVFDNLYTYQGGNLLIGVKQTVAGTDSSCYWYGVSTSSNTAVGGFYGTYFCDYSFLPKLTFAYHGDVCNQPDGMVFSGVTFNSATFSWNENGGSNWQVQYKASAASDWSETITVNETPSCSINNLNPGTEYRVRVRTDCGGDFYSEWTTATFETTCGVAIPYSYNFQNDATGANAAFPQCWTRINNSESSTYNYYPYVVGNDKVLKFIASANTNAPTNQIAVMPEMIEDINTLRMSFTAYLSSGNSNKPLSVGVMTDPNDASTFTKVVDVVVRGTNSSTVYPITLEGYQGNGHYIAFKCDKLTSGSEYSIFIDNIHVETVPAVAPLDLPYNYNFDDATTGYDAFPPEGWHFSNTYFPYVREAASMAHSGSNLLEMQRQSYESASYAALPAINTNEHPINTLQMTFWARKWNSTIYNTYLSVGVMTDPNDMDTYQQISSVEILNNYSFHEVYFDDYVGEGQYIVFRCYCNDNYLCIDDIEVSVAPTCLATLDLRSSTTYAHEAYINWKTRKASHLDYQVSYSTDEGFDPDNGTIVDVHFDSPLSGTMYRDYQLTCLDANMTYYFYVRSNCGNGVYSEWSDDYASFITQEACPAPVNFTVDPYNTYADFEWYGDPDEDWVFQYKKLSDEDWITPEFTPTVGVEIELKYQLTGLAEGVDYVARLRRHCGTYSGCTGYDDGYSEWEVITFSTGSSCGSGALWMCTSHLGTQATVLWHNHSEDTQWQIRYRLDTETSYPAENIITTEVLEQSNPQKYTITGLQPNKTYYCQVRGYCDESTQGDWSNEIWFVTRSTDSYITVDSDHPYYEDFENGMPEDWSRMNLYNYNMDHYDTWQRIESSSGTWESFPPSYCISSCKECMSWASPGSMILMPAIHIDENATSAVLSFWSKDAYNASDASGTKMIWVNDNYLSTEYTAFDLGCIYQKGSKAGYWRKCFVNLDDFIGQTIIIAFDYVVSYKYNNYDWWVDDVRVEVFDKVGGGSNVTSGDWNSGDFWGGSVPGADDNVIINANVTIPEGVVAEANQIVINTDSTYVNGGRAMKFGKLTIADGGQLKVNNPVEATVEKTITGYGNDNNASNGWYFIAPPVVASDLAPEDVDHLLDNTYDLYRLNPSSTMWENFKVHNDPNDASPFLTLDNGHGYLYANSNDVTLSFTGDVKPYSDSDNTVSVAPGWNLVGNPYTCDVAIDKPYSTLTEENNVQSIATGQGAIHPCQSVAVYNAGSTNMDVTFSLPSESAVPQNLIQIALSEPNLRQAGNIDNAVVSFEQGAMLPKFHFGAPRASISIPQGNEEYAIVNAEAQGELPLNFKTKENGEYTLTVSGTANCQLPIANYLHLIDNLTGADIDLLQTPSYTFTARNDDYPSRFKLVFSTSSNDTDDDNFAFVSNGEIIITEGDGTVQVIDMLGRLLYSHEIHSDFRLPTSGFLTPGVYLLRLTNGKDVKTQKIVIR